MPIKYFFIFILFFACSSEKNIERQKISEVISVDKDFISGSIKSLKYSTGHFVALTHFGVDGQKLFIINKTSPSIKKELVRSNQRQVIGGIAQEIFVFADYFYLFYDIGDLVKFDFEGNELNKSSVRFLYPDKNKCQIISLSNNLDFCIVCYSLLEQNPRKAQIISGNLKNTNLNNHYLDLQDNIKEYTFQVKENNILFLSPYLNTLFFFDMLENKIDSAEIIKSKHREYFRPKEYIGSAFEYSKLSQEERTIYLSDKHINGIYTKNHYAIISQRIFKNKSYLLQYYSLDNKFYHEIIYEKPIWLHDDYHLLGYNELDDKSLSFFIYPLDESFDN